MGITRSERLFVERRRLGESQEEAAWRLGISLSLYERIERGKISCPDDFTTRLGSIARYEKCVIFRRRIRMTQKDVARSLGCSVRWVQLMECGEQPCQQLREFWGDE